MTMQPTKPSRWSSLSEALQIASPLLLGLGQDMLNRTDQPDNGMEAGLAGMIQLQERRKIEAERQALRDALFGRAPAVGAPGAGPATMPGAGQPSPDGAAMPTGQALPMGGGGGIIGQMQLPPGIAQLLSTMPPEQAAAALVQYGMQPDAAAPSSVREYEYAKQQGFQGSYFDFTRQKAAAGATRINNSVVMPGQAVPKSPFAEIGMEQLKTLTAELSKAQGIDRLMSEVESALDTGTVTGPVQAAAAPLQGLAVSLGIADPDTEAQVAGMRLINSVNQQMLSFLRVVGSGATSDFESRAMVKASTGADLTVAENRALIDMFRRKVQQTRETTAGMEQALLNGSYLPSQYGTAAGAMPVEPVRGATPTTPASTVPEPPASPARVNALTMPIEDVLALPREGRRAALEELKAYLRANPGDPETLSRIDAIISALSARQP